MKQGSKKPLRTVEEWEYTADEDARAEAQRLARKVAGGEATGEVVLHLNRGRVLRVTVHEVKRAE
jgi:hypothetical protein